MFRRSVLALLTALAAAGASAPARADAPEHAVLAIPADAILFMAHYVALDLGFFKDAGVDLDSRLIVGMGSMNAVIAGSAEFSYSSGGSLTRAAARGQRLLAIANMNDRHGQQIVLRKELAEAAHFDPNAPLSVRAQVLKGRNIAVDGMGTVVHSFVRVVAKAGGYDPESITVSPMQPADTLAAMDRHAIDGFASAPPWIQTVVANGTAVIVADGIKGDPQELVPIGSVMLVTRPQLCVERKSLCEKMGHVMARAATFVHEHKAETIAVLKKRFPNISDPVLAASYEAVVSMTPTPPVVEADELAHAELMNVEAGFMKPEEKVGHYDGLFTAEYVK
ncbi:MAG TPA: ABC transporter substrate-binding protein [Stellaceae bacterium]|nr:ABC transporter substrate-binding protein [Stellaceae bacterium]